MSLKDFFLSGQFYVALAATAATFLLVLHLSTNQRTTTGTAEVVLRDPAPDTSWLSLTELSKGGTIITFGDTLTYWTYPPDASASSDLKWYNYPYSTKLAKYVGNETRLLEAGVNGERTDQMLVRLTSSLENCPPYPLTCILVFFAGGNDLQHGNSAQEVVENLRSLHQFALDSPNGMLGAVFTVAITVPQPGWEDKPMDRLRVNEQLRSLAEACPQRVILLDLDRQLDLNNQNEKYWGYWSSDKVHLSPSGYDMIAKLVYTELYDFQVPVVMKGEELEFEKVVCHLKY